MALALTHPAVRPLLHVVCCLPGAWLVWAAASNGLGANPAEALIRATGDWTLRLLCLALAVTPLRLWLAWPALARFRRMLGLYCFFYALWHLLCYSWLDLGWDWAELAVDVGKRPFILVGLLAFALLLLLALSSPARVMRWLGGRCWQRLHRAVYLVAPLAVLHFWWLRQSKNNLTEVWFYAALLAALLLARWPLVKRRLGKSFHS